MGRKEPCQNKHTSPDSAGRDNIDIELLPKDKIKDNSIKDIVVGQKMAATKYAKQYKGKWDEASFRECVTDYFTYSADCNLKLCKAGLRVWLSCSRETYNEWLTHPEKHSYKTDILKLAGDLIELSYIDRVEKYPTGNIFLLKTSHGHIEQSKLDITSNGQQMITSETEIQEMVSKLGLDK